jgi:hypothetical protein
MKNLNRANTTVGNPTGKYPLIYLVKIKRGVSWSIRRIELDRERIKYFKNEKDNELRFNEKTDDCNLLEKNTENDKKFYLLLVSKSGIFKEVKIWCEQVEILRQLKKDFDFIQNYKSTISNIQNKTFIIESDKRISRSLTKTEGDNIDDQTVHKSILGDEASTITKSIMTRAERPTNYASNINHISLTNEDYPVKKEEVPEKLDKLENLKPNDKFLEYPKFENEENLINNSISQNNNFNEKESVIFTNEIEFKNSFRESIKIQDLKNNEVVANQISSEVDTSVLQVPKIKNQSTSSNIAAE